MNHKDLRLLYEIRKLGATQGKFTLTELAKRLNVTHVAVGKRIRRLVERGEYRLVPEVNLEKAGYRVALVKVEVPGFRELERLKSIYSKCPRTILMMETTGDYNLQVLMYAETEGILKSILTSCSIRTRPEIRRSEVVVGEIVGGFGPIVPPVGGELTEAPCGMCCAECQWYESGDCKGCPLTVHYRP